MTLTLVAAVARNGVIGRDGGLPWRLPEDLAHFKRTTLGGTVIMGRRTFESIGAALSGRRNVVVTRNPGWRAAGVETAASLEEALALASRDDNVFVIGGHSLYEAALPLADALVLTEIDADYDGDTRFPDWDRSSFELAAREAHVSATGIEYAIATYRRASPRPG